MSLWWVEKHKPFLKNVEEKSEALNNIPFFQSKEEALCYLKNIVKNYNITDAQIRPRWCFVAISSKEQKKFIKEFFPKKFKILLDTPLTPKLLCVAPQKKLSWQYHNRRSELWILIQGQALISVSKTDKQPLPRPMTKEEVIKIETRYRHRLIGDSERGIVAEIWEHTDPHDISDENDIVRIEDDRKRN